jgi:hypothetical protein
MWLDQFVVEFQPSPYVAEERISCSNTRRIRRISRLPIFGGASDFGQLDTTHSPEMRPVDELNNVR